MNVTFLFIFLFFQLGQKVYAYPENVRHGYVNCTTCHYSPTGGGLTTPYGRELSRDLMSTWGKEGKEALPFYGVLSRPPWLDFGGDLRVVQIYRNNPYLEEAKFIPMQFDAEVAAFFKNFTAVTTVGFVKKDDGSTYEYELGSRRHYLMLRPTKTLAIRAGKFLPNFGLNIPDHIVSTKRNLNFDQGSESYNAELSYIDQKVNIFATGIFGRPDRTRLNKEKGASLSANYAIWNKLKIGGSYFYGKNNRWKRHIWGLSGILGFTQHLYLLSEWDFQKSRSLRSAASTYQWGRFTYNKLGYEFIKGIHTFFAYDMAKTDIKEELSKSYSFGPGLLWYPRPHYELSLSWLKQKNPSISDDLTDFVWLMMHIYL